MWLKLANATFSVNLGQMSVLSNSISIKYNGLNGAFAINKSSVSKDDTSAELKLTLNSGWTCTSASATVTGASETSDSYSNGVLTISIKPSSGTTFKDSGTTEIVINVTHDATGSSSGGSGGATTNYTFTINPTPTSATVTLTATGYSTVSGTGSKSITVANGTKVNWTVSASGYTTRTGNWTISGGNKTENVVLVTSATPVNLWKYSSSDMDPIMTNARYRLTSGLPYKEEGDAYDKTYGTTEKIYVNGNSGTYTLDLESGKTYRWQFIPYFEYGFLKLHNPWGGSEQTSSMEGKRIFFYKADDTLIENDTKCLDATGMLVTVPADAVYMRFMAWGYDTQKSKVKPCYDTLMITEGETEYSEYVPYQG